MSKSKEIALPKMTVNKFSYKLYVVYHVCPVGSWASIVEEQINQFADIFAKMKISKLSIDLRFCSIVPSSKSFFKNSVAEKIRQESNENQMIVIE